MKAPIFIEFKEERILINGFIFLYVFNLFNREFVPVFDLRYILMAYSVLLFMLKGMQYALTRSLMFPVSTKVLVGFLVFLFLIVFSNFWWFKNPFRPDESTLLNASILYGYNLTSVLVFWLYSKTISRKVIVNSVIFSSLVLFLSMVAVFTGFPVIFGGNIRMPIPESFSPIGLRVGGYAEDQNYATLSMIFLIAVTPFVKYRPIKGILIFIAGIGILLSFSKTVLLGMFIIILLYVFYKLGLGVIITAFSAVVSFVALPFIIDLLGTLSTMSIRFRMWNIAIESFLSHPLFGTGLTSVRSNFEYSGGWYVQPHNNFIAIAVDHGLIVLLLYLMYIMSLHTIKNKLFRFVLLVFLFLSMTSDLWVFPYPVFTLVLLPILFKDYDQTPQEVYLQA